jgi:hypothetical protein
MKKLALASVAFAGVTAFGAGDSFAAGFVGYTSTAGFSSTDTTVWGPVGESSPGGTGGTAGLTGVSTKNHIGVTASYEAGSPSASPTLTVFNQNCGGGTGNAACGGFKPNTHLLGNNGSGAISLVFTQKLSALGFELSPQFSDWDAHATFFTGPNGNIKLGSVTLTGMPFCRGTDAENCRIPAFIGATDTTLPITGATISLSNGGSTSLLIGTLDEELFPTTKIPEPASLSVLGAGLLGLGALRRRRGARDPAAGSRWSRFGRWRVANGPPDTKHLTR